MPETPRPFVGMYSFKTPDPARLASFWAELMRLPKLEQSEDLVMLDFKHEVASQTWMFEKSDRASAGGPVSIDISNDDEDTWGEVAAQAEDLGAQRVADHEDDGIRWIVMTDPDGNQFRVFAPRPE